MSYTAALVSDTQLVTDAYAIAYDARVQTGTVAAAGSAILL